MAIANRAASLSTAIDALAADGICVIPNFLTADQVARARRDALDHLETHGKQYNGGTVQHDMLNHAPSLLWLLSETAMADTARAIIGDDVRYAHHADLLHNTYTGWHKDSVGHDDHSGSLDFWSTNSDSGYRVYKFALYLQDHSKDKTALKYIPGSHLNSRFNALSRVSHHIKHANLRCGSCDLVVFDQRLTHNGVSPWLPSKILHKLSHNEAARQRLWRWERRARAIQDRVFIQIAFGGESEFTVAHSTAMAQRQTRINGLSEYGLSPALLNVLTEIGIQPSALTENTQSPLDIDAALSGLDLVYAQERN